MLKENKVFIFSIKNINLISKFKNIKNHNKWVDWNHNFCFHHLNKSINLAKIDFYLTYVSLIIIEPWETTSPVKDAENIPRSFLLIKSLMNPWLLLD